MDKYLQAIKKLQNKDGSFFSFSIDKNGKTKRKFKTIFQAAIILGCLSKIDTDIAKDIKQKIFIFLQKEKSRNWTFNYWAKNTIEYQNFRVPDDMDDTMAALAAMYNNKHKIFGASILGKITQMLTRFETKEGGPYQTWLIENPDDSKWRDCDIAVNAQVGYFLSLFDISLPNLQKMFDRAIETGRLKSLYYPNRLITIYYLSRFYRGKKKEQLIRILKKEKVTNPLLMAICTTAFRNLGEMKDGEKMANELSKIKPDQIGLDPFCLDPSQNGKKYFLSGKALTLAFVCEALFTTSKKISVEKKENNSDEHFIGTTKILFEKKVNSLASDQLSGIFGRMWEKIMEKDVDREIVLINKKFAELIEPTLKKHMILKLATANLFGWMAYTIYDDLMDQDSDSKLLPCANLALIQTIWLFEDVVSESKNQNFRNIYGGMLTEMEKANLAEMAKIRFSPDKPLHWKQISEIDFKNLIAEKSLPHIVGPMIMSKIAGWNAKKRTDLFIMLKNYLIARQLNDDAHDIIEDLFRGHLTYPGWIVLRDYFKKYEAFDSQKKDNQDALLAMLWTKSIKIITSEITQRVDLGRTKFLNLFDNNKDSWFLNKLNRLEAAANKAIRESKESIDFISEF